MNALSPIQRNNIIDVTVIKPTYFNPYRGKPLTKNEVKVLRMIARGETNKSMASIRRRSIKTIEKQRHSLMRKTGLNCIADLTQYALAMGYCENKFGGPR